MLTSGCQIGVTSEIASLLNYLSTEKSKALLIFESDTLFKASIDKTKPSQKTWQIDVYAQQKYKPIGSKILSVKPWFQLDAGVIWFKYVTEYKRLKPSSDFFELLVSYLPEYSPTYYVDENLPMLSLNISFFNSLHKPEIVRVNRHFFRS